MLTSDIDAYYSPANVAEIVARTVEHSRLKSVIDSHCGRGALLDAVEKSFPKIHCAGIDLDRDSILHLRKIRPHWTLFRGDSLSWTTWEKVLKKLDSNIDLAVLNPPFSMGQAKGVNIELNDKEIRGSLAMAHVISTIQHSSPSRIVAILPESTMFSDMDRQGRAELESLYDVEVVNQFKSSTFRGARVNSLLVGMTKRTRKHPTTHTEKRKNAPAQNTLVRGGLPCFEAMPVREGIPFIHSTDIKNLLHTTININTHKVQPFTRGIVKGYMILLPRVGVPQKKNIGVWFTQDNVQLSDCVIALLYPNRRTAHTAWTALLRNYESLVSLYRGTGARYITIDRLSEWITGL
ncbi:methyltransferase [Burkholderia gladioli]|uniref:methyltransferase n=1 Tax=Burkholderia gladioli TaxID=28095 RepID=UPI001CF4AFFE|nr:methyltransferase [Burkholderia gladioli]MCA8172475.1 methyltransferase [Burkholderia gladioli]